MFQYNHNIYYSIVGSILSSPNTLEAFRSNIISQQFFFSCLQSFLLKGRKNSRYWKGRVIWL